MTTARAAVFAALLTLAGACAPWLLAEPPAACGMCGTGTIETRLFFGLAMPDGKTVTAAEWDAFVADVVTPRFPDGLTVLDARGQYRLPESGEIRREPTRVVLVVHPDDAASSAALDAIVAEYRRRFAQRSVLRVDVPVRASF